MKNYKVLSTFVTLHGGTLILSADQVKRRSHLLSENDDGSFSINGSVGFKKGEIFHYDGVVNRSLLELIEEIDDSADVPEENIDEETPEESVSYPYHEGAGWYRLSNGSKIRGERHAIQAQSELNDTA